MAKTVKKVVIEGSSIGLDKVVGELAKISSRLDKITSQQVNLDTSAAQTAARNLSKSTDSMASSAEKGQARASKALERLGAVNRATGRDMSDLTRTSASALTIAYAEIAANVYAAAAAFNAVKAGAQFDNLLRSQDQLAKTTGTNFSFISQRLKEATGNAIDFQRAAQYANLGRAAGLSTQQISKLAEAGTKASIALGRDLGDSIDRIFRGTIKGEPEILDELGIIIRLGDATEEYAKKLNVKADALTSAQKSQAIYNAVLKESAKFEGVSADPDAFTRLAGAIRDAALEIGALVSRVFGPLAGFLADNRTALLGFGLAIGSSVLGKAFSAFGSDVAGATERLKELQERAGLAQVAATKARTVMLGSRSIASDLGSNTRAKEFREVAKLAVQGLGDISGGTKQLTILNNALNDTTVKARDIPGIFANIGGGATSMAQLVSTALQRAEKTGSATFLGIKNVSRAALLDIAGLTQAAISREIDARQKALASTTNSQKNRLAVEKDLNNLSAQSTILTNQLKLASTRATYASMTASVAAFTASAQVLFAGLGVKLAMLGGVISASLGWIGIIATVGTLLGAGLTSLGLFSSGMDKVSKASSDLTNNMGTLREQIANTLKPVDSLTQALVGLEARASALDVLNTLTTDLSKGLQEVKVGPLSELFDFGTSDLDEQLQPLKEYFELVGRGDEFSRAFAAVKLVPGEIKSTQENVEKVKLAVAELTKGTEAWAAASLNAKTRIDETVKGIGVVKDAQRALVQSLMNANSNILTIYNQVTNSSKGLAQSSQVRNELEKEYERAMQSINSSSLVQERSLTKQSGLWQEIRDKVILFTRDLNQINAGPLGGLIKLLTSGSKTLSEQLAEQQGNKITATLNASKNRINGILTDGQNSLADLKATASAAQKSTIEEYEKTLTSYSARLAEIASLPVEQQGKMLDELYSSASVTVQSLASVASSSSANYLSLLENLATLQSRAALSAAQMAANNSILDASLSNLGSSLGDYAKLQEQIVAGQSNIAKLKAERDFAISRGDVNPLDLQIINNGIKEQEVALAALIRKQEILSPLSKVFGSSLLTEAALRRQNSEAILKQNNNLDKLAEAYKGVKEQLDRSGEFVDITKAVSAADSIITSTLAKLKMIERNDSGIESLLDKVRAQFDLLEAAAKKYGNNEEVARIAKQRNEALLALRDGYNQAAVAALALADAESKVLSAKAIEEVKSSSLAEQLKLEVSAEISSSLGFTLSQSVSDAISSTFKELFDTIYNADLNNRLNRMRQALPQGGELTAEQVKQAEAAARATAKAAVVTEIQNKNLLSLATTTDDLTRSIELQQSMFQRLREATDAAIDGLFGIGNKSGGEILKDLGKGLLGDLFGNYKETLKKELDGFDLAGTIGKVIPEGLKESFGKVSAFFGKGGGGATFAKSAGAIFQGIAAGAEKNGFQGALIQGAFTAIGAIWGPIGAAIGSAIGGMLTGTAKKLVDSGLILNIANGQFSGSKFTTTSREKSFMRGTETKTRTSMLAEKESEAFLKSFENVNQSFTSALNKYASYFQQEVRAVDALNGVVFGEKLSLKGLKVEEQQKKIQSFFAGYGDALVEYAVPGLKQMQKEGETLIDTLNRVTRVTMMADTAFKSIFNLDANGAKSLLGSRSPSARKDLTQMVLREVRKDLEFAYSFVTAKDLDVDVKMPKEKSMFGGIVGIVLAAVIAVVTAGIGAALVGAVATATGAGAAGAAVAAGVGAGGIVGATAAVATAAVTGTLTATVAAGALVGGAIMSAVSTALANAIIDGAVDAGIGKNILFTQEEVKFAAQDGFGANLKSIQNLMQKYRKGKFTLTADKFALDLETGLFEETQKRITLFRSKGGKGNAKKLQATYEKQLNLLNEYSTVLAYLTLQAAGIDLEGTNLEAKALGQIRAKFYDEVMGFFDGADAKEKEEGFTKALQNYAQGTSSTLELVSNGVDGALNSIKASVYTITGAYEKDAKDLIASLDYVKTVGKSLDIAGKTRTGRSYKKKKTNNSIVEGLFKSFTESLGLSADNQLAAYEFLTELTAEEIASTGNLSSFLDTKSLANKLKSKGINVSGEIVKALQAAMPALQAQFTEVTQSLEIMNSITTRLNEGLPETQLPSLIRFTKIFDDVMALAPNPEVVAEMIKIGDTLTQAIAALSDAFKGFNTDALIGYLEKARDSATSFSELGTFVASEFVAGTRAGLKDTFKNAIVEDFQKQLVGPILAGVANAVSGAFAGNTTDLVFQLTPEEIAATEARLLNTATILADLLANPTLNTALDTLGTTLGNITSQFLDLTGSAEEIAEVTKDFSSSIASITANIELEAFTGLVKGDELLVSRFKAMQAFRDLGLAGFGTEMLNKPLAEVIATANSLIQAGAITKDNIGDVTSAIQALADVSSAARQKLEETASALDGSLSSITDKISGLTLDIIKAGTGNKVKDLADAGVALDAYLASVYLSVNKARNEYEKAKLDGNLILAAEKAGELESALTNYSQAQIDAIKFTSDLSKSIYEEQTKSLEGLKDLAQSLKDFVEDIKFDERLSILKPIDRLAAAEEDFASLRQRILSGELDITKLTSEEAQKVIEDSRRLLDLGRDVYASGNEYTELYNQVMQTIGAAQAQVDSAVTLTDADIAQYQTDSLAVQAQIRNIQLSTLSELQLIAAQLGVNGALVQAMSESGTFNVALDPTTVRQYAYDNTEVLTLLASAISNTTSATDTGYMPLMDTYLSAVLANSNPLSIQNLLGTMGGDMFAGSLDTLLSAYGTFTNPLAGFNFGGLEYFSSDLGQSAPSDVALLPVAAPTYDTSALIEQLLAAPINNNLLNLGGATTPDSSDTTDNTLTRDELLDVRLIEVLDKLELVLAALPLSLRTAILQQNIATQRV